MNRLKGIHGNHLSKFEITRFDYYISYIYTRIFKQKQKYDNIYMYICTEKNIKASE